MSSIIEPGKWIETTIGNEVFGFLGEYSSETSNNLLFCSSLGTISTGNKNNLRSIGFENFCNVNSRSKLERGLIFIFFFSLLTFFMYVCLYVFYRRISFKMERDD